jgi:hypothetical protein
MSLLFAPLYSPTCHLHLLSFLHEEWSSTYSCVTFHTTATVTSFPLCKLLGRCSASCLLWLACLFTFCLRGCHSPTLWSSRRNDLFATCLLFLNSAACFLFSLFFLFFPPGWGSVCPGVYADLAQGCLWEYHMLLSTHGGLHLPKQSGSLHLAARSPPGFSV